jgi:hypothetical protein
MLFSFIVLALTGIIKMLEIQQYLMFVYNFIPASKVSFVHDWSGIILIVLISIHLVIKLSWFFDLFRVNRRMPDRSSKYILAILIIFVFGLGVLYFVKQGENSRPIGLTPVEVRNYQGEKLGSIRDFRENSIKGVQHIDNNTYRLEITGLIDTPVIYDYEKLLKLQPYQKVVQINCVEGWSVNLLWEGIRVKDILKDTIIKPQARTIIFYAADGYSTSFPIDYILNNNIIMAYKMNNVVLPPERGFPFQLVAEQKWGYKWIKWITKIELSDNVNYQGYWEQRGYNNNGDLNGSKYQ